MPYEVREQKLREGQEIGKLVLLAEARLGELFNQMPKVGVGGNGSNQYKQAIIPPAGNNSTDESEIEKPKLEVAADIGFNKNQDLEIPPAGKFLNDDSEVETPKPKLEVAADIGFNKNQVSQFQKLADNPDAVQKAIADAEENDEIVTRSKALENIKANDATDDKKQIYILRNTGTIELPAAENCVLS